MLTVRCELNLFSILNLLILKKCTSELKMTIATEELS